MEPWEDRLASRRAEIKAEMEELDRQDAERAAAAADVGSAVVRRPKGGSLRGAVTMIALIGITLGLIGLAVTLSRMAGRDFADAERAGTATVASCEEHGPISNRGFGYWTSCTATVNWDGGGSEYVFGSDVFTSADIGATVRVGDTGQHRTGIELARPDQPERPWLRWIGIAVGLLALIPGLPTVLLLKEMLSFRRRR
ncbi:DUF6346 domain-containing protein [Actinoplanes sp. NPDC024001]|uniref:DUF6346 domain-containing protein n=1 Tax=Actinoplanes sp. NPDC024001 TaxID=3154598 RepID=UPI0033FA1D67